MKRFVAAAALAAFVVPAPAKGQASSLPTYSYVIHSGDWDDGGAFVTRVHYKIPNTFWLCDITYGNQGMIARCSAPSPVGGTLAEVDVHISCEKLNADSETMNLSSLDQGVYATVSISCRRLETDVADENDGF